jgi:hypothetical protein
MTEFKQIVGRGTRIHEDSKKFFFTLMDFRGASNHFADPDFDGEPVQIYEPDADGSVAPPDPGGLLDPEADETTGRRFPRSCSGAPGQQIPRASPATSWSPSSTVSSSLS